MAFARWGEAEPLWKVLPKQDASGKPLNDFMMLAPGLKKRRPEEVEAILVLIRGVLDRFGDVIVFADFNLSLSLLWVSLKCQPGAMSMVVAALRAKAPMLKLVAHNPVEK